MKAAAFSACSGILLSGCAGISRPYRTHPGNPALDLRNDSIFVLSAPPEEVEIGAIEHFRDDFRTREGDREAEMLAAYFDTVFLAELKSWAHPNFRTVVTPRYAETGFPFRIVVDSGGKNELLLRFWIPHQKELAARGIAARYTLSVAALDFRWSAGRRSSGGGFGAGSAGMAQRPKAGLPNTPLSTGESASLDFSYVYVLWDYHTNDYVACGIAQGNSDPFFGVHRGTWRSVIEKGTQSFLRQTPLKRYLKNPAGY